MGFFDFLKKKPQEQPVVEQTEEKDVVEIAGIEVNTTPEKEEDIVLNAVSYTHLDVYKRQT